MSERDELFDIARAVIDGELGILVNGSDIDNTADSLSYAILAAGYRKPRTITTAKELDALPNMAVIIDRFGGCSNIIRNNPHFQAADYHYLLEHTPITVLYEPTA